MLPHHSMDMLKRHWVREFKRSMHSHVLQRPPFLMQIVQALRPNTLAPTGCAYGHEAAVVRHQGSLAQLCVAVIAPGGPALHTGRVNMMKLGGLMAAHAHTQNLNPHTAPAAAAAASGKLRFLWVDGSVQRTFCAQHFSVMGVEVEEAVCGGRWGAGLLRRARAALRTLASTSGGLKPKCQAALSALRSPPAKAYLLAYRPAASNRAGTGPGSHLFSLYTQLDLSSKNFSDPELVDAGIWLSSCISAPAPPLSGAHTSKPAPLLTLGTQ